MSKLKIFGFTLAILIFVFFVLRWLSRPQPQAKNYDKFAQCLAEKRLTMYGASWCSHCQNEKRPFGQAFQYIPYIECPTNPKLCVEKGVKGYPTWITAEGIKYEGEQGLGRLAEISGCQLP